MRAGGHGRPGGVLRYVAMWLLGGALVATAIVLAVGSGEDDVRLPPVRETRLEEAATQARCQLRTVGPDDLLELPVAGASVAEPLPPGVYDDPPDPASVVAAIRRGTVVLHYTSRIRGDALDRLEDVQRAVPEGTIVAPAPASMPYELAATAWRRLLGCPRYSRKALDAVRLFRGRFIGSGPDRG